MPDANATVIDGQPEPSYQELLAGIADRRAEWDRIVDQAGDRVTEPGVAGDWNLRDVDAHINAYLRFHVGNLGGMVRPFGEMPEDVGWDMEKRNQWMHREDLGLPWDAVRREGRGLHEELMTQLRARSPDDMRRQLVTWHHWPTWRWMCDARNHYDEHLSSLEAWLARDAGAADS
jgi:hypothetical protein